MWLTSFLVFGPWRWTTGTLRWPCARKLNFDCRRAPLAFWVFPFRRLRTGQNEISGFVFNFQDLTELKRLEREVSTKEHMAALGRLSAAIAHEIRQPLTAMTGALKELARLAPLDDDDKKLVQIVSRESQRLNQIITEFLDYSREKTYAFGEVDVAGLIEETMLLARARRQRQRKVPDSSAISTPEMFVRAPIVTRSSRCVGTFATTRCAPCRTEAVLTVGLDCGFGLGSHFDPRYGHGP